MLPQTLVHSSERKINQFDTLDVPLVKLLLLVSAIPLGPLFQFNQCFNLMRVNFLFQIRFQTFPSFVGIVPNAEFGFFFVEPNLGNSLFSHQQLVAVYGHATSGGLLAQEFMVVQFLTGVVNGLHLELHLKLTDEFSGGKDFR